MSKTNKLLLSDFPGGDIVTTGLADLKTGIFSEEALLLFVAAPRLRELGFIISYPQIADPAYEFLLYETIEKREPDHAYPQYKALISRIVSFANAYEQFGPVNVK